MARQGQLISWWPRIKKEGSEEEWAGVPISPFMVYPSVLTSIELGVTSLGFFCLSVTKRSGQGFLGTFRSQTTAAGMVMRRCWSRQLFLVSRNCRTRRRTVSLLMPSRNQGGKASLSSNLLVFYSSLNPKTVFVKPPNVLWRCDTHSNSEPEAWTSQQGVAGL